MADADLTMADADEGTYWWQIGQLPWLFGIIEMDGSLGANYVFCVILRF